MQRSESKQSGCQAESIEMCIEIQVPRTKVGRLFLGLCSNWANISRAFALRGTDSFQTCASFGWPIDWPDMMLKCFLYVLIFSPALVFRCFGAGLVGEPAPPLTIQEWMVGQPVTVQPGTNIFLLEIWNSTSVASRACITNLNHVQKHFQSNGVVVVAISDEPVDRLRHFLQSGVNIEYAVAADERRQTANRYLAAVKHRGVPYAFIVGTNGQVLWHGLPVAGIGGVLAQIITGKYDVQQARKYEQALNQMQEYLSLVRRKDFRAALAGQVLLANRTNDVDQLCDMAYQIATTPGLPKRDFALAGQALDQAEKLSATNHAQVMITRAVWLFTSGKEQDGMSLATQALASAQGSWSNRVEALIKTMQAHKEVADKKQEGNTNAVSNAGNTNDVKSAATPGQASPATNEVNAKPGL